MQEEAAGRPQHAVHLAEALRHAHQIGQQTSPPHHRRQPLQETGQLGMTTGGAAKDGVEAGLCDRIPSPGVGKCPRLPARPIVAAGMEWRVGIAEIDRLVREVVSQNFQIVAAE